MRARWAPLLRLLSLATLSTSCSLLFDTAPGEFGSDAALPIDASDPAIDSAVPCPDLDSGLGLLVVDDFECGAIRDAWTASTTNTTGGGCRISTEQAKDGGRSLQCATLGEGGDRAAVYLDFPATDNIRVEMDVFFTTPPPQYLTFLQTVHLAGIAPHQLVSMNYLEEIASPGKISFYSVEPYYEQNGESPVPQNQWLRVNFNVRLANTDGLIFFDTNLAGMSTLTGDTLNSDGELITRLEIGIVDASTSDQPQELFIDNVQATRSSPP